MVGLQLERSPEYLVKSIVISSVMVFLSFWYFSLCTFLLLVWIRKLNLIILPGTNHSDMTIENFIQMVENKIWFYNHYQESFGKLHLFLFSVVQVWWITATYSGLSLFYTFSDFKYYSYNLFSCFIFSPAIFVYAALVTFSLHEVHDSLMKHIPLLNKFEESGSSDKQLSKIRNLKEELRNTGHITAMGFFEISRSTVVSMLSFGLTYVIILLQFKMSSVKNQ